MKYAIKRLTPSDLTLFEWQFRHAPAGHQKAINLNADVFVNELFPALIDAAPASGKLPVDLFIYGPGPYGPLNLQRKIVKGSTYKNWRLNGEFIYNPDGEPDRFNSLKPGDIAVFGFDGAPLPETLHLVLISGQNEQGLYAEVAALLGAGAMVAVEGVQFQALLSNPTLAVDHPLRGLTVDADLEDIAVGVAAPRASSSRRLGRPVSREQLARGRAAAALVGRVGEEIVQAWLDVQRADGNLDNYTWVSDENAIAPFDFKVTKLGMGRRIEVKATSGAASRPFPISIAEIEAAATSPDPYDVIRVSNVDVRSGSANIHRCEDIREYAKQVLAFAQGGPAGCAVDSVSIDPAALGMTFLQAFMVAR